MSIVKNEKFKKIKKPNYTTFSVDNLALCLVKVTQKNRLCASEPSLRQ